MRQSDSKEHRPRTRDDTSRPIRRRSPAIVIMMTVGVLILVGGLSPPSWSGLALKAGDQETKERSARPWLGLHVLATNRDAVRKLTEEVPALGKLGVNVLICEVNYNYAFASHPELAGRYPTTTAEARKLSAACREHGIRLIPQFQCLGHQSWKKTTFSLLTRYPHFDETPGAHPENEGIYCRSWCPLHPDVNKIVFELMDELIDGFEADALHVGMDEVFLIGEEQCERCRGKDKARLFAKAVKDYHRHLVGGRQVEMLLWGDRLLDASTTGYGRWEASDSGTHRAIDMIPKDIIVCDWHYEPRKSYPSIPIFIEKGFRVWPAGWHKPEATRALIDDAFRQRSPRMVGYLCTTWGRARPGKMVEFAALRLAAERLSSGKRDDVKTPD